MADGCSGDTTERTNKRKAGSEEAHGNSVKRMKESFSIGGARQELRVVPYANSHAIEIKALSQSLQVQHGGKLVTQKLPRHMRRRAMSHNIKRLPRNVQPYAKGVYANQKAVVRKRPSRYHRRRPKNLLHEYSRRSRKHVWLETHIWHAKRFHMVEKWGFKLPWKPTDKSHRAAYRATKSHCLLQDMSYMCCIELAGDTAHLIERLSQVTSTETGQTFASKACLNGTREGKTVMYEKNQYPWKAIGPVNFMWKPTLHISNATSESSSVKDRDSNIRTMWLWCHPCIFDAVWTELIKCFNLTEKNTEDTIKPKYDKTVKNISEGCTIDVDKSKTVKKEKVDEGVKTVEEIGDNNDGKPFVTNRFRTKVVALSNDRTVIMKSLTGSILRYRLTGPQSTSVLVDTLTQANIIPFNDTKDSADPWWKSYFAREEMALCNGAQREFMEGMEECQSPAELSPHCVVAATVQDPRLGRPAKKIKVESKEDSTTTDSSFCRLKVTPDIALSPLWDEKIRTEVKQTKLPDYKIFELKSDLLVPGTALELGDSESKIPVILVQRPGVTNDTPTGHDPCPGHGSGWDLLLPESWGMPFWLALVFRGARCGGLQERECSVYEERSLLFPNNFPDTAAGLKHQSDVEDGWMVKYNRTPPAKRANFTKLGVSFPYFSPWNLLTEGWMDSVTSKCPVDGNENLVKKIDNEIAKVEKVNGESCVEENMECVIISENITDITTNKKEKLDTVSELKGKIIDRNYFVLRNYKILRHLHTVSLGRNAGHRGKRFGNDNSIFAQFETSYQTALVPVRVELMMKGVVKEFAMICIPNTEDMSALLKNKHDSGPMEPKHADPKLTEKKKQKREMKEKNVKKKIKINRNLKKVVETPEDVSLDLCSRRLLGFVCTGGFSLSTGTGGGVGFVAMKGLMSMIKGMRESNHTWTVLVRNNTSLQYRYARLSVLL